MNTLSKSVVNCMNRAREGITASNIAMSKALDDLQGTEPLLYAELRALLLMGSKIAAGLDKIRGNAERERAPAKTLDDIPLTPNARGALASLMQEGGMQRLSEFRFLPQVLIARQRGIGKVNLTAFITGLADAGIALGSEWPKGENIWHWKEVLVRLRQEQS